MKPARQVLVGITATALLGLPGIAAATSAAPPEASAGTAAGSRYNTSIRFLDFDHTRPYASRTIVRGQVVAYVNGNRGAVKGKKVWLYRKFHGSPGWTRIARGYTSQTTRPTFRFTPRSRANATYLVRFPGNAQLQRSQDTTVVLVHRLLNAQMEDRTGRFHGRVVPRWANRAIYLEKRQCASCSWQRVRTGRTGDVGRWSFRVSAPADGRWWWRAAVPASTRYIWSYSGIYTTERG